MVLDVKTEGVSSSQLVQNVVSVTKEKDENVSYVIENEENDTLELIDDKIKSIKEETSKINYVETRISTLQKAMEAIDKEKNILDKMHELVSNTDFKKLSKDEKIDIEEKLITYVEEINDISDNTFYNGNKILKGSIKLSSDHDALGKDKERLEFDIVRTDPKSLGLKTDNAKKLTLESVRINGESYIPPYTFDVTDTSGASTALSVIGSAITRIDSFKRKITIDLSELMRYPDCLKLDRNEFSMEQSKIRSADNARRTIAKLQNMLRVQINEAQRSQSKYSRQNVLDLLS